MFFSKRRNYRKIPQIRKNIIKDTFSAVCGCRKLIFFCFPNTQWSQKSSLPVPSMPNRPCLLSVVIPFSLNVTQASMPQSSMVFDGWGSTGWSRTYPCRPLENIKTSPYFSFSENQGTLGDLQNSTFSGILALIGFKGAKWDEIMLQLRNVTNFTKSPHYAIVSLDSNGANVSNITLGIIAHEYNTSI